MVICGLFYVVNTSLTHLVGDYLYTQKLREEERAAQNLAVDVSSALSELRAGEMLSLARETARAMDGRVLVVDPYGAVLTDTEALLNGTRMNQSEVAAALTQRDSASGYYALNLAGEKSLTGLYACPVVEGEQVLGAVVLVTMAQDMYDSLSSLQLRMLIYVGLLAVLVFVLSMSVTHLMFKPINEMNEVIAQMTRGDLSVRVKAKGRNEFARMAQAFNMMCERLESLDHSRSQFVSNASHELKTPLSTMKILIETMLYQEPLDEGMAKEFLGDINKEIDRLSSIIGDLLTLVKMDDNEMKLSRENVSLNALLEDNVRRLQPLAREKGIEMSLSAREPVSVPGDPNRLTQVFYNLIDNAVKYTPRGGRVRVELGRRDKKAFVKVSDTGIGIPKADQMHVFDRFYRVDKARSRETGGTGLGLSIVKQIVLLHGGTVSLVSEEDKGSAFTVELPQG